MPRHYMGRTSSATANSAGENVAASELPQVLAYCACPCATVIGRRGRGRLMRNWRTWEACAVSLLVSS